MSPLSRCTVQRALVALTISVSQVRVGLEKPLNRFHSSYLLVLHMYIHGKLKSRKSLSLRVWFRGNTETLEEHIKWIADILDYFTVMSNQTICEDSERQPMPWLLNLEIGSCLSTSIVLSFTCFHLQRKCRFGQFHCENPARTWPNYINIYD